MSVLNQASLSRAEDDQNDSGLPDVANDEMRSREASPFAERDSLTLNLGTAPKRRMGSITRTQQPSHHNHRGFRLPGLTFALMVGCCLVQTNGFMVQRCIHTKTPPLLSKHVPEFDLEALEAYEAQLAFDEMVEDGTMVTDSTDDNDASLDDVVTETFEVSSYLSGKRVDGALAALLEGTSRTSCGNMVTSGCVTVVHTDSSREAVTRKSFKIEEGQKLEIKFPTSVNPRPDSITAQDIPLDILWEDDHLIVLNKAPGMVVHPAAGNWEGTIVNALAYYLQHVSIFQYSPNAFEASNLRPGIVHRLDKGTTGVLVVAKTPQALSALSDQFASRSVKKTYLAITVGNPGKNALIDKPICRHPVHRQRMRVAKEGGRRAITLVDNISFDGKLGFSRVQIATGRTHQIRVHLTDRHTPILGDDVYGLRDWNDRYAKRHGIDRPLLHAYRLRISHPITNEPLVFQAPIPSDMETIASLIDSNVVPSDTPRTTG